MTTAKNIFNVNTLAKAAVVGNANKELTADEQSKNPTHDTEVRHIAMDNLYLDSSAYLLVQHVEKLGYQNNLYTEMTGISEEVNPT